MLRALRLWRRSRLSIAAMALYAGGAVAGTPQFTVLHSFSRGHDGGASYGGLIADAGGALYGTTYYGGSFGHGTVFKLSPPAQGQTAWAETVLHSFAGGSDGASPEAGLIFDAAGNLYGVTGGGSAGVGTVFKLSPPASGHTIWGHTVLREMNAEHGANPLLGALKFDAAGSLYGASFGSRIMVGSFASPHQQDPRRSGHLPSCSSLTSSTVVIPMAGDGRSIRRALWNNQRWWSD